MLLNRRVIDSHCIIINSRSAKCAHELLEIKRLSNNKQLPT